MSRVQKALPYLVLLPAVLPLVYIGGMLYPYVAPKTLLFRADGILLLAALVFLILSGGAMYLGRLKQKLTWIPLGLLVVAYVTSLFGIDFYHSFWSVFDRGDGLLTLTVLVAFFYGILLTVDELFFERLARAVAWVASLVGLYVLLQWIQGATGMNLPLITEPNGRFGGTLGNAAYLAAYLGLTFFVTLIVAPEYRGKWKAAIYAGAALQLLGVLISATRGTILALAGAGILAAAYTAWKGKGQLRTYARGAFIAGLLVVALFFVFRDQLAESPIEPIRRVASISVTESTVSSRLFIWQHMLGEAAKSPIFGYGAEHVDVLFDRFYDPGGIVEQWFDRSHNAYLDYLIQYGIVGLALYLALILAFAWTAWKLMRVDERAGGLLLLMIAVFAAQNLFLFDIAPTMYLFLAFFAAALAVLHKSSASALSVPRIPYLAPAAGTVLAALMIPVSLMPLIANVQLARGYYYHIADIDKAVGVMQSGLALGTYADLEYGYQAYVMYTERQAVMLSGSERVTAYQYAEDLLRKNYERYPYDARTATYYAHVLDMSPPEIEVDEARLRDVIAHAIELSPKRIQPWYMLANISLKKGDALPPGPEKDAHNREGIAILSEYAATVPQFAEPRFVVATLYQDLGDAGEAKKWADEGLAVYEPDKNTARRASRYYLTAEDWPNAVRFLQDSLADEWAENWPTWYDLAKAKLLAGDRDGAEEIVEMLRDKAPGLVEQDPTFLQSLGEN